MVDKFLLCHMKRKEGREGGKEGRMEGCSRKGEEGRKKERDRKKYWNPIISILYENRK